ncbi:MAG TPA: ComF family protein [Gaiellales bacterium]
MRPLLDVVLPPRCALCPAAEEPLCGPCLAQLPYLAGPACARCGRPTAIPVGECRECAGRRLAFERAAAAVAYEGGGRTLVGHLKSGRRRALAVPAGAVVAALLDAGSCEAVCWVPGDRWRTIRRGCHPAELLAREAARRWGLPALDLLEPARLRRAQRGLDPAARRRNVRGAFRVRRAAAVPRVVAIVDDVYTTGATLDACARALRDAGARAVHGFTLARAVRW